MSWLYTIIFAGLMFGASDNQPPQFKNHTAEPTVQTVGKQDETERFEQNYPLNSDGRISISNVNGSITIGVWDKNEVRLEYVKTADSRERLSEVQVKINARQDSFTVETDYGDWKRSEGKWNRNNRFDIQYHLTVPRGANLADIETVNGSINITGAANQTKASAVNGEVRAVNLSGAARLSTVNGVVVGDFDRLAPGGRITLETVNGTVDLTIPSDASATVKADSLNGNISNDFGLPVRKGQYVGRDLYGRLGAGDVQIKLSSVNGSLSVKRKNDGKNLSPATNLLTQKSKSDEEDFDRDLDEDVDEDTDEDKKSMPPVPPVPPVPNAKRVKVPKKVIERAVADAAREIERIQPELERLNADEIKKQMEAAKVINTEEMQAQIKAAQDKYRQALEMMTEASWVGSPVIERKNDSFQVKGTPKVTIEAKNCAVSVRGWDKQEVSYSATRISKIQKQPALEVSATQNGSDINIKLGSEFGAPHTDVYQEVNRFRIEVFVPKKSNLKIKADGEIRLEGVSGEMDLQGVDGTVNVRDADGKLSVGTSDGTIRVIGFRGAFDGKTSDGVMNLEGDFQTLNALASDGTIVLTLPEDANAVLEANTEIESDGVDLTRDNAREKIWRVGRGGATYRMSVDDGKVIVRSANAMKIY